MSLPPESSYLSFKLADAPFEPGETVLEGVNIECLKRSALSLERAAPLRALVAILELLVPLVFLRMSVRLIPVPLVIHVGGSPS